MRTGALRRVLPDGVLRVARRLRGERVRRRFAAGERVPRTPGYAAAREALVRSTLDRKELLKAFRSHEPLLGHFGVAIDERCVEYPWVLSRLDECGGRLLDTGSPLNPCLELRKPVSVG